MINTYNDESIKVLSDIAHIRQRSSMYISTDRPSYQMWTEIADNAIDEAMNGYADKIRFDIAYDRNLISVEDNGRGLPQGMNEELKKPTIFAIYQKLNAGGKYDQESYAMSGGLNGVGSTVVNALSKELNVISWRDHSVVLASFAYGETVNYDKHIDEQYDGHGTKVSYTIDTDHPLFTDKLSDYEKEIEDKISLLKTLMPQVTFYYNNEEIGVKDFREFLILSKDPLLDESILIQSKNLMVALNWSKDTNKSTQRTYCNSIYTPNGGDHEKAVYDAIVNYFNNTDATYGLNIAVSVMYPAVEYDSQAKTKAISKSMRNWVSEMVQSELNKYFKKNPDTKDKIIALIKYKRNEINKRNNKSNVRRDRKSTFLNTLGVSGFADCNTKDRETAELFIVEGNSAAGSAIQARDVNTQAILPLRGKFINAFTSDAASLLKNAEVATIVSSIDVGIFDDVNIRKSRYNKVIIFTDADEDGKNIACLLISFFLATMPELVEAGMLYLALPPLYGTYEGKKFIPINDEDTKNKYLKKGYQITRYKGLGEMNPEQLAIACMNPDTRSIIRVDESPECIEEVRKIMGSDTSYRRKILQNEGILV
jgi:DNA gyrase subunit B